eukprot:233614_1
MEFIGRQKQLKLLRNIIDNKINFNLIHIHGPASSGKSLILNHVLKEKNINYVYVPCHCICNVKHFFHTILNGLYDKFHKKNEPNEDSDWTKHSKYKQCNSTSTFLHILQNEDFANKHSFYIVLDNIQKLCEYVDNNLILSLIEITQSELLLTATDNSKIGIILIDNSSSMIKSNLKKVLSNKQDILFPIHFNAYNNQQIQKILRKNAGKLFTSLNMHENEIKEMIKHFVSIFNTHTNRIDYFYRYLALLMPKFAQISNQKNKNYEMQKLIYQLSDKIFRSPDVTLSYNDENECKSEMREPDLGYASKLLLLSSYLASFNSNKFNKHEFTSAKQKRMRRKKCKNIKSNGITLRQTGPKQFTIRDLSGIFIELFKRESPLIYDKDLTQIHDVRSPIANLISLHYISIVSADGTLDDTKFKCNMDHQLARFIAKKIGIKNWGKYLEDS